jgi:methyl-accepting chemotaxis protein
MSNKLLKSTAAEIINQSKTRFIKSFKIDKIGFRSLRVTLAFAFLALSAIVLFITSSLNMYNVFVNNRKVVADQQQLIAKDATNTVKSFVQEKFGMLEVAAAVGDLESSYERQKIVMDKLFGLEPAFRQLFLLTPKGDELCKISRLSSAALTKATEKHKTEVLEETKSAAKTYISSIYIDEKTFEPMIIMAVSIRDIFGHIKGILMAEVNLKFMWDLVGSIQIGKKGQVYVVSRKGDLIAAKDVSRVLKGENLTKLKKVSQFISSKESHPESGTDISKGIEGTTVVASYVPLVYPDWAVLAELPVLEAYGQVITIFIISILIMIFSFILAVIAGFYISKRITKPLIDLRDATKTISEGNLNTRINVKSKNEIGELAFNFNQMVVSLGNLINNTKKASQVMLEHSVSLKNGSNESLQTSESVEVAMKQITKGTFEQTVETEKTANQMNDLAKTIDSVVINANEVESITGFAKALSLKSKEAIHLLTQKARETDEITNTITKNIKEFITSIMKIQSFTGIITGITEQSNLLALNASIEAARAGEAGRGFAVVAEEMNKLASQSRDAAKIISNTIKAIHSQSVASVEYSEQAHLVIGEQITSVLTARDSFDEIVTAMDGIIERTLGMIDKIKKISDFKEKTLNSIMAISSVSEESAASSQEVLASTEEQTAIAGQIRDLADKLYNFAGNLVVITNSFVVDMSKDDR